MAYGRGVIGLAEPAAADAPDMMMAIADTVFTVGRVLLTVSMGLFLAYLVILGGTLLLSGRRAQRGASTGHGSVMVRHGAVRVDAAR